MKPIRSWKTSLQHIQDKRAVTVSLYLLLSIVLYVAMFSNIQPEKLNITLFSIADRDILSPVTVEDWESTVQKRQEAAAAVEDQYILKTEYTQHRVDMVADLFDAAIKVKANEELENLGKRLSAFEKQVAEEMRQAITPQEMTYLLTASLDQLDTAKNTTITAVQSNMKGRIKFGEEDKVKEQIAKDLRKVNLPSGLRSSMVAIGQYAIIPNYVYDVKGTAEKKQQMMESVQPVKIRAGQVLVKEGQVVDRDVYRQLDLVGLLDERLNPLTYIGLGLLVMCLIVLTAYFFKDVTDLVHSQNKYLVIYVLVYAIMIALMKILSLFQQFSVIAYAVPVAMATMLIKMLINDRSAIITSMTLAICGSIIFNEDTIESFNFIIGVYFFLSGITGVIFLSKHNRRSKILQAGFYISVVNMVAITALFMIKNGQYTSLEIGTYLLMAALSGFLSAVLTLGLMPFFEAGFGMLSTIKLIELSNPNHPLLRKILTETPGTYHHSVMVANLADAACEAIGADGFLARVGAYYHDIGKTKRPRFFIENQLNMENPHNKIAPQLSKTIITAHPYDGAKMLREYKIPQEIIDFAEQHHGTTLLKYFYHQAKEKSKDVRESDFRYPGPKAQTKESAIVGIADSVEAAVRSMQNPTPQRIENLVRNIISDRLQDGQFDECDLTLKEIDIAAKTMCETLNGIFHSRIEYPEMPKKKVKQA
ncbi:HD family phosphohydrolase [Bacillus tianshenii]|nr:HD family phosphohydrolase [Bacillus tianshenii]